MSMSVTTIQPGYTNQGIQCQHCVKSQAKNKTFCSIASHHRTRILKHSIREKKSGGSKMSAICDLTQEYSARNLIIGTVLLFPEIETIQQVLNMAPRLKTTQLKLYLINFHLAKDTMIYKSMEMAQAIKPHFQNLQEVKLVKKPSNTTKVWNMDLIMRNKINQEFGLIIPSQYYLFKLPLSKLLPVLPVANQIKMELLRDYGFNEYYSIPYYKNENAREVMEYAPGKNQYWEHILQKWYANMKSILEKLVKELTFPNVNHPIYILRKSGHIPVINSQQGWTVNLDTNYTRKPSLKFNISHQNECRFTLYVGFEETFYQEPVVKVMFS